MSSESKLTQFLSRNPGLNVTGRVPRSSRTVIGCGGFSDVYKAILEEDGQALLVALKTIRASLKTQSSFEDVSSMLVFMLNSCS